MRESPERPGDHSHSSQAAGSPGRGVGVAGRLGPAESAGFQDLGALGCGRPPTPPEHPTPLLHHPSPVRAFLFPLFWDKTCKNVER